MSKKKVLTAVLSIAIALSAAFIQNSAAQVDEDTEAPPWAVVFTTQGNFIIELFEDLTPNTVKNFIQLARGTKEWLDPKTNRKMRKPFYNGLEFFRIIPTYFVQTGCPLNRGTGTPGYTIKDEYNPKYKVNRMGMVVMAKAGPNTNGSQFFITLRALPWLNPKTVEKKFCSNFHYPVPCRKDKDCKDYAKMFQKFSQGSEKCQRRKLTTGHTVFGRVVYGMEVVQKMSEQPLDARGRPLIPIKIIKINIFRGKTWKKSWLKMKEDL